MAVTLHTTFGDIKLELMCDAVPKTCENFLALCASGYYNGCKIHRNIKEFMMQTGDPTGTFRFFFKALFLLALQAPAKAASAVGAVNSTTSSE